MKYNENMPKCFTGQRRFIESPMAAVLWEILCDKLPMEFYWRIPDAVKILRKRCSYSDSTLRQYTRALVINAMLDEDPAIERHGQLFKFVMTREFTKDFKF